MRFVGLISVVMALSGCGTVKTLTSTGIVKVLPHYLDEDGHHTYGPTLLHRDGYQKTLRSNPDLVHGVRYDVNWHGTGEVTLRLELRSTKAGSKPMIREQTLTQGFNRARWTPMLVDAETYLQFGQPEAWRVSLWRDEELLDEVASFLW